MRVVGPCQAGAVMSVKHALLALLYRQPMHGYELGRRLSLTVAEEWVV